MKTIKFEVIADYPGQRFEIGDIIEVYELACRAYIVSEDKYDLRDFPALFKRVD